MSFRLIYASPTPSRLLSTKKTKPTNPFHIEKWIIKIDFSA